MHAAKLTCIGLCAAALLSASSCSINPATGSPDFVTMSESKEISIGKEMHEKILASTPIYQNQELQDYVNSVGQKIAATSDRPDLDYHFTIIDSPDINAFALPGGYLYINRGLMGYLNSEAQLAAVLAHEIAHVTARHAVRQKTAHAGAGVLSVLSVLTTGSSVVGDVTSLWSSAAVLGYGREMELEADSFGAQYLFNAGYEPSAMVEVIGVLKDQETFARRRAREAGKKPKSYHGVFSTHPRNDQRLQGVIAKAGSLSDQQEGLTNENIFRQKINGMVYGANYNPTAGKPGENNRYTHSRLGFTLLFPDAWAVENQRSAIVSTAADKSAQLSLEVTKLKENLPPDEYIMQRLGVKLLKRSEPLKQAGLLGHTGIKPAADADSKPTRMAVFYQGSRVYLFTGKVNEPTADVDYDDLFISSIRSFRPMRSNARAAPKAKAIRYVKANEKTTFARLAQHVRIGPYGEEQLRLLNGYYPRGEPKPGEWVKIVQ